MKEPQHISQVIHDWMALNLGAGQSSETTTARDSAGQSIIYRPKLRKTLSDKRLILSHTGCLGQKSKRLS